MEITIVGDGSSGLKTKVLETLKEKGVDVALVDSIEPKNTFVLNNLRYARKPQPQSSFFDMNFDYNSKYERKLSKDIDIIKEYGLIQEKKSKLSKWERDAVVKSFESEYYPIN